MTKVRVEVSQGLARCAVTGALVVAVAGAFSGTARAQGANELPEIVVEGTEEAKKRRSKPTNVTDTRLTDTSNNSSKSPPSASANAAATGNSSVPASTSGDASASGNAGGTVPGGGGITGSSTSIITQEQIARSPQSSLVDIIAREAGVQSTSLYGGVNGVGSTVDMRGFGATAPSNTLILIDGRRLNDWDLPGFDLSTIAKDSIDRIEITRGNSGAVLYGDGAVGGVINIVTRGGVGVPNKVRAEGGYGSYNTREGTASVSGTWGIFSGLVSGNTIESDGYRDNNELDQQSVVGDFRWTFANASIYLNVGADDQKLRLPGTRDIVVNPFTNVDELNGNRRGTKTPFDYADKQGLRATAGFTYLLTPGFELIVDGGVRDKDQQAGFFGQFSNAYVDTELTTTSLTPRVNITLPFFGLPSRLLAGIDYYETDYKSDRSLFKGLDAIHVYDGDQKSLAAYFQQTVSLFSATDISVGGRVQQNDTSARDTYDPNAPQGFVSPPGLPLDDKETNHAWHLGIEQGLFPGLTLLGRAAQSFRVANIDERIGALPVVVPTDFDLETQKSHDWEAGARFQLGGFNIQSSYYDMRLTDEIHFNPVTGANANFDPTRRRGVETIASWQVTADVRLRGNLTYTEAKFREGEFAGNDVPLVSPWTGNAGVSWNIFGPQLWVDANVRYFGRRYLDGNENNANAVYFVPSTTLVDVKIGGELENFFWSAAVQNVFDEEYFEYGLDLSFPPFLQYSFYPLPGRTYMLKAGVQW